MMTGLAFFVTPLYCSVIVGGLQGWVRKSKKKRIEHSQKYNCERVGLIGRVTCKKIIIDVIPVYPFGKRDEISMTYHCVFLSKSSHSPVLRTSNYSMCEQPCHMYWPVAGCAEMHQRTFVLAPIILWTGLSAMQTDELPHQLIHQSFPFNGSERE